MVRKYEKMSTEYVYENCFLNPEYSPILQNFINLSPYDKPLDVKHMRILYYYLKNPDKNAKEVEKASLEELKGYDYRTILRYINYLCTDLKLIELVTEKVEKIKGTKTKYKKPYRLSLNGIFYVILNTSVASSFSDIIFSIIQNYKNNILLTLFLYPFIEEQTILAGWNGRFFSNIVSYLKSTCRTIIDYIIALRTKPFTPNDGYVIQKVFVWFDGIDVPSLKISTSRLQHFLKRALKWDWIDDAKIIPKINENEHLIEIRDTSNPQNSSVITILENEKKAVLRQNGIKLYEFSITHNDSILSLDVRTSRKRIDAEDSLFVNDCKQHLLSFLTKIRQMSSLNVTFDSLSNDKKFKKALNYMDNVSVL